jgi:methionyl-tRNA synthetase
LDQTGSKILAKSKELNLPVTEYIKLISDEWRKSCDILNIEYDSFYETYTKDHSDNVKKYWDIFLQNGDIYEKEYSGKYCIGCESFKLEKDLNDGSCSDHPNTEIETVNETNFFFNLSKYKSNILSWLESDPILGSSKNELYRYLNEYEELSISRKKTDYTFDIEVPGRPDQVIYVWFSALLNYIFVNDWDNTLNIQLCGPDNIRFQGQIFQSFLSSLGKKNTNKLLVHGTILDKNGRKISKTLGNVVDPIAEVEKYGLYPVRYYILATLNTYSNCSWNETDIINHWNSEIVNDWGNLVSRVLHLIDIKCGGVLVKPEDKFLETIKNYSTEVGECWDNYSVKDALSRVNDLVNYGNKYINDQRTWASTNYQVELSNLKELLLEVNRLYTPIFGQSETQRVNNIINSGRKQILFNKLLS